MARLPVIVGFGGYNSAGRSSFHRGYQRMVIESLPLAQRQQTLADLACLMGLLTFSDGQYKDEGGTRDFGSYPGSSHRESIL